MKIFRFPAVLLVISAVSALLAACGTSDSSPAADAVDANTGGDKTTVNIAINAKTLPMVISKEKGWFEEEFAKLNAEVAWSQFPSGPPLLESLSSGRVDLSFLGDGAAITGVANGLSFQVIGMTNEGKDLNGVLVPAASPVQTLEELKGKKLGLAKGTTAHIYWIKLLNQTGLSPDDFDIINLQPEDAQAAFESGKLDAWVIWDPYLISNTEQQKARLLQYGSSILAPGSMIARSDFAKDNPELVTAYLKVYAQALDWIYQHPDEVTELYSAETKLPDSVIKQLLEKKTYALAPYTEEALNAQQETADIMLENGFIKNNIVFKDAVDNQYIQKALEQ